MATIVGEALLAASLEALMEKIVSGEFVDLFRRTKLDVALLEKLKITMTSLGAVLHDAEEKQINNTPVKQWLDMLRDAVFEADNLFDEINTDALRCKVEAEYETQTATTKVLNKLSFRFKRFNKKINSKLQMLFERLEHLRNQNLGFKEGGSTSSSVWHITPTTSVVGDESNIYGRYDDKKKLKEFLLSEDSSGDDGRSKLGVISIVGMGGLGKTTLAKLLYNDHDVKEKFEVRGWAHVSKDLDVVSVTKTLHDSVTSQASAVNDLNVLQVQLQQSLRNKKYLLVLDDIWFGSYVGWNSLNDIFNVGKMGSKIIITTRDARVALPMQTFLYVHHLRSLETEDCWTLLARHAFVESNYQQRPDLEKIGREIAKKCDGLPLAAAALGGLLRTNLSQDHWNGVLKSNIWELPNDEVQPALLLSYRHLPSSLKGCFAYCSIFPKNSILKKKMVVQLWIAEGLVAEPKGGKSWENIAEEYFDELVARSLIRQRFVDDEKVTFEMHDLINDLTMIVSSPYCIRLDEQKPHERVRHLSYNKGKYDSYDKFDKLHGLNGLRTFLPFPLQDSVWDSYFVSDKLVCCLLPQMKQLRVLSLSNYMNITELPNSIGNLTYLRYLNLSHTNINMLPSETCKLYNLQTLLLSHCQKLTELPKDIGKLVNLRHLDIRGTQLKEMPVQLSQLENLQTLSDFVVSTQDVGLKITDLGKYPHLQGKLSISQLQNVTDSSHAFQANLEMKKQIDKLVLQWFDVTSSNSQIQSVVLEQLRPSTNLKSLTIRGYGGKNFPSWLGGSLFCNMVYLMISHCENCLVLPSLGHLCNLKKLFIGEMKSVKSVGTEFHGSGSTSFQPFPSLETLEFDMMLEWEEWKLTAGTTGEFPRLTCLSLRHCPKLIVNIPLGQLGNLKKLSFKGLNSIKTLGTEFYGSSNFTLFQPFPSLETLSFEDMQEWEEWKLIGGTSTEFPSLTSLTLSDCPKLKGNIPGNLPNLTSLTVDNCPELEQNMPIKLPSLTELELCRLLRSDHVFRQLMIPLNSLQCLTIKNLSSLTSFPRDGLPKTLKSLTIRNCENLEFLPCESFHNYKLLEKLFIVGSGMTSFTLGSFPVLKSIIISGCKNLKSILIAKDASQHNLLFLSSIDIGHCDELDSVSLGGLSFPNLIDLYVIGCKKLRSLPESIKTLSNLQKMTICNLPNLQSFSMDDIPISLRELIVGNVGGILLNKSWECYTSLSKMHFRGDDIVMALMKMEVPLLPTSLVTLRMYSLKDIECLDGKWLQHLTSLQKLKIVDSPKLKSLTKEGKLPCSLKLLSIDSCPLLKEILRRKRGKEWSKIAHIPAIVIGGEMIT